MTSGAASPVLLQCQVALDAIRDEARHDEQEAGWDAVHVLRWQADLQLHGSVLNALHHHDDVALPPGRNAIHNHHVD